MMEPLKNQGSSPACGFQIPRWEQLPSIDLYMDQVIAYFDDCFGDFFRDIGGAPLTKSMVNNYVKAKIVDAPVNKKYNRMSLAMIVVVFILKHCYTTEEVGRLLQLGISLEDRDHTAVPYNRFCEAMEKAVDAVFAGEIHLRDEGLPGRERKYLMENVAMTFATKIYVEKTYLR